MQSYPIRVFLLLSLLAQGLGLGFYGYKFFVLIFAQYIQISWAFHEMTEVLAFIALLVGTVASAITIYRLNRHSARLEDRLDQAAGRFHDVICSQFAKWDFSEAETEIGILLIKGMSIAEIADLRGRSQATIKAQNSSIYQKSGLTNRAQLVSFFVEELTSGF